MKEYQVMYYEMKPAAYKFLGRYLLDHEHDIADSENDFGELLSVFIDVFRREPKGLNI